MLQENNLQRQKLRDNLLNGDDEEDDDDDAIDISSESSCEGMPIQTPQFHKQYKLHDQEIWQNGGIDETLKELPNADMILDILNDGGDLKGEHIFYFYSKMFFNPFYCTLL